MIALGLFVAMVRIIKRPVRSRCRSIPIASGSDSMNGLAGIPGSRGPGQVAFVACLLLLASPAAAQQMEVDFNRDIRPLLANSCYKCHGPDEENRQADLRLDIEQGAKSLLESGSRALVPGNRRQSELYRRIVSSDPDERMPPPRFVEIHGSSLSRKQVELIGLWIDQGAPWNRHWSYIPPHRPPLPAAIDISWPRTPVDLFVSSRMKRAGMDPVGRASRLDLLRRLTLDLTGLPPTIKQAEAFMADSSPDADAQLVDRLLASPRFGERFAVHWLDLARYADTHGYHIDNRREMWRWRDWVIQAFNRGMPYDQFTIEQLAGDLLPGATAEQQLATGFHRNTMLNFEGGAIAEEYLSEYVVDRVITTAAVWLGQTMECCRCHDHKYDPLSQRDFYGLYAYFNNIDEKGLDGRTGNAAPLLRSPTPLQAQASLDNKQQLAETRGQLEQRRKVVTADLVRWQQRIREGIEKMPGPPTDVLTAWPLDLAAGQQVVDRSAGKQHGTLHGEAVYIPGKYGEALLFDGAKYVEAAGAGAFDTADRFTLSCWVFPTSRDQLAILSRGETGAEERGYQVQLDDSLLVVKLVNQPRISLVNLATREPLSLNSWHHVAVTSDGTGKAAGVSVYVDGELRQVQVRSDSLNGSITTSGAFLIGAHDRKLAFRGMIDDVRIYRRTLGGDEVGRLAGGNPIREIIDIAAGDRTRAQAEQLRTYFLEHHDLPYRQFQKRQQELEDALLQLEKEIATTMVMREREMTRETFLLIRGDYQQKGDPVKPGLPTLLAGKEGGFAPSRLGLARWLVDEGNPLTARVAVNRIWLLLFGQGLVRTPRDFGTRGEWPTHPDLLDWLAVEFVESGWDLKQLVRQIVLSATYQQTGRVDLARRQQDPDNRFWSRAPRLRLDAEVIRDQALAIAGLLDSRVGGTSVFPYHPPGLWREISFNPRDFTAQVYRQGSGQDLYRRSLYTFWKRAVPPPAMAVFDAPNRETCVIQRPRTTSPLQGLVLMNDPTYVEAARCLADRLLTEIEGDDRRKLALAMQTIMVRQITGEEQRVLSMLLDQQRQLFREDPDAASALVLVGESPCNPDTDRLELAAWTTVIATILLTDEAIHKP